MVFAGIGGGWVDGVLKEEKLSGDDEFDTGRVGIGVTRGVPWLILPEGANETGFICWGDCCTLKVDTGLLGIGFVGELIGSATVVEAATGLGVDENCNVDAGALLNKEGVAIPVVSTFGISVFVVAPNKLPPKGFWGVENEKLFVSNFGTSVPALPNGLVPELWKQKKINLKNQMFLTVSILFTIQI